MTRFVDIVFSNLVLGCFSRFSLVPCCEYRRVALKGGHSPSTLVLSYFHCPRWYVALKSQLMQTSRLQKYKRTLMWTKMFSSTILLNTEAISYQLLLYINISLNIINNNNNNSNVRSSIRNISCLQILSSLLGSWRWTWDHSSCASHN
jgi:hypothetical protein